ncbi:LSU ribosomal protein L4P [Candidatus Methanoperedens nitroreducens]|uniref:Large ribosomal subunit protein uL4 n=1 Tax=Candidatus Methanoperedens nitratireducens TaxID=1392998 RepID=A0A062V7N2_9EURY|nr:50S ribosomal protein L4 [Candidatus Methanoperedens nitroreducens]KCZ73307.1 LSU ribosomal protein L4P [Candidatus Methanoperedens nitroreducens]MDJ1422744.1 50S ribosomal protein L4 [Candidatus Methanoperedens sp.]
MEVNIIDLSGNTTKKIASRLFDEPLRPDLIKKAVLAAQANRQQPYGPHTYAGMRTSAEGWGPGRGVSRVARLRNSRRAARIPQAVKGRQAHPPKPETDRTEKINDRERKKAIRSAIAATGNEQLVKERGHRFQAQLPLVAVDDLAAITKTKDVKSFMEAVLVWDDILRAKDKTIRAGKGKRRGRKYKRAKSILIVTSEDKGIAKAARNLAGVDIVTSDQLNAELLAPGTYTGRLTIYTESAIAKLEEAIQ